MTDNTQHLSVTQTAAALGISRQRVLVLVSEGRLPATRVGSYWMIRAVDLEQFIASRTKTDLIPDDYRIYNRRREDGTYPPISGFFDRKQED